MREKPIETHVILSIVHRYLNAAGTAEKGPSNE